MSLLDPPEAFKVRELLSNNSCVAAAQLLQKSKNQGHRVVRSLIQDCVQQLVALARESSEQESFKDAHDHIQLAAELQPLSGEAAMLRSSIETNYQLHKEATESIERRLCEARRLADAGRLNTSIESTSGIDDPRAKTLEREISAKLSSYERNIQEAKALLDQGNAVGAAVIFAKIKKAYPDGEMTLSLEGRLRKDELTVEPALDIEEDEMAPQPVSVHDHGVLLDFGMQELNSILLFGNTFVIGRAGGGADIQLTGAALHAQHAIIVRNFHKGKMSYWLMPHPHHQKYVAVNGKPLSLGVGATGTHKLAAGDEIRLGASTSDCRAAIVFEKASSDDSANDQHTALLRALESQSALAFQSSKTKCNTVVLFSDFFTVGNVGLSNVFHPRFPASSLNFNAGQSHVNVSVENGELNRELEISEAVLFCNELISIEEPFSPLVSFNKDERLLDVQFRTCSTR